MAVDYWTSIPVKLWLPVIIALSAVACYFLWIVYLKRRAARLCGHYAHTLPQVPIIGNFMKLIFFKDTTDMWEFITESTNKYRQGVLFWCFHLNWIFIQEVDVVEAILMNPDANDKSYVYSLLNPFTDGVFSCNGLKWRKLRKKLNLTFSQKQIEMYFNDVNEQAGVCLDILKKNTDKYINLQTFLTTYFVDVVFRTHFGMETQEQYTRKYTITERGAKMIEVTMKNRFFNIFLHPNFLFKFSQLYKFIDSHRSIPLKYIRKVIDQRMKLVDTYKEKGSYDQKKLYFVDLVREVLPELNIDVTPYSMERNTSDVIVAASDTTSVAVSAAIYYLALYPKIQEKVFQEVISIYGECSTKHLTKDDFNKMKYLEMVIKETLRLTAPPGIVRDIRKDMNVGKYILPKGINAFIAMKAIHENPAYWEKPTQFYPEHFLPEKVNTRPKFAFLPFSMGPRNCPGMVFSYVTMKTIISNIVRNFKLETDVPLEMIKFKMVIMQESKDGFRMKLTSRLS